MGTAAGTSVLFVYDGPRNVVAVVEAGLTGLHYRGMDDVRPHLESPL